LNLPHSCWCCLLAQESKQPHWAPYRQNIVMRDLEDKLKSY